MTKQLSTRLTAAARERRLVRFTRPFEGGHVSGYVLDVGPRWLLVALVGDGIRFNGFQCFRVADVRGLEAPPSNAGFVEAALRKRRERRPRRPRVSLAGVDELLRSAGCAFPLVTVHREAVDPDVCQIGRVVGVDGRHLSLLELDESARWDDAPMRYALREVTRVDFGGEYEEALHLVAGDPPAG